MGNDNHDYIGGGGLVVSFNVHHGGGAPGAKRIRRTAFADFLYEHKERGGAVLNGLALRGRQMEGVTASGASFRHVDLSFASLRGADLNGADLSYACLIGTDLTGALLDGANVNHATLNVHVLPRSEVKTLTGVPVRPGHTRRSARTVE